MLTRIRRGDFQRPFQGARRAHQLYRVVAHEPFLPLSGQDLIPVIL